MAGSKKLRITGWVISILIVALLTFSAMVKFSKSKESLEAFDKLGFSADTMAKIGVLEISLAVLYLIPPTSFLGAILLTGYLGGATLVHLRAGESLLPPIIVGVIMWLGCAFRMPEIFALLPGVKRSP
jgi:hypothetical protein